MAVLLVVILCIFNLASAAAERKQVTALPGFNGALPFSLETGYVAVDEENGAELFYYFIESEGDPGSDPVLLWLTGGDRCTVFSGLVYEIGPVKFIIEPYNGTLPQLRYNPYSWTKAASILFVDSPVGAGFSFSRNPKGYNVGDVSSSLQLVTFLTKWFTDHPSYITNPFYIGGDSYAGKVVPFLVQKISEGGSEIHFFANALFSEIEAGSRPTLNLKGYLVGNPRTGENIDYDARVPYAHGVGIISDQLYESILKNCGVGDYNNPRSAICAEALNRFNKLLGQVYRAHILYDRCIVVSHGPNKDTANRVILKEEAGLGLLKNPPPRPPLDCITYGNYLSYFWANTDMIRDALGIKKGTVDEWVRCHSGDLPYSQDVKSSIAYHYNVTSKGYRALVYSGDHDAVVPFLGTQTWVRSLNFSIVDGWRAWHLDGQSAGFTITYSNNVTFATVKGGGHTAPEFQPERCLAMFKRWILNTQL
ncbi:hypothetical protein EJB05_28145, partial [Eragrostis curvula]